MWKVLCTLICVWSIPVSVSASVIISEFMYDARGTDATHEWVELYNDGTSPVDLSTWKINDGSNHVFNAPPKNGGSGSLSIPSRGYLILAGNASVFSAEHPGIPVSIIDTSLSLSNAGDTITLIADSGTVVSAVSYTKNSGAGGNGNTVQWDGSAYVAGKPTPGSVFVGGVDMTPSVPVHTVRAVENHSAERTQKKSTASQQSPTKSVVSKSAEPTEERVVSQPESHVASAAESVDKHSASTWWGLSGVVTLLGASAVAFSRRLKKQEWDIEEIPVE